MGGRSSLSFEFVWFKHFIAFALHLCNASGGATDQSAQAKLWVETN